MLITQKITLDMQRRMNSPPLSAVQGDSNTRAIEATLLDDGTAWEPPEGCTAAISYRKQDGTSGLYDKMPDGSEAFSISGNTVTVMLAPQVLTCVGRVNLSILLYEGTAQLATFPLEIRVAGNPSFGGGLSNDYYNYQTFGELNAAIGNLEDLQTQDKSSLVAAINEARHTGGGGGGVAPTASVKQTEMGAIITCSDASGTTTAEIRNGTDGYTPEKGVDYFTQADKQEMVADVLAALPEYRGEVVS